ncbi:MAG TPA: DUF4189 domain-containing protein [Vicinamibacteria bacterium]|nr:DUF4189 domain-containing protein [Vicinamibacteria bacterium]
MTLNMQARPGEPRPKRIGLVAGFLTVALAACGQGTSPTSVSGPSGTAGACHVTCSDYSTSLYVAIAVSPSTLECGTATNMGTSDAAKKAAVSTCGKGDCVPVVWGQRGVAAVAVDQVAYGWGWAADAASTADSRAIASCVSRTPLG